jgi:hypothetical protein
VAAAQVVADPRHAAARRGNEVQPDLGRAGQPAAARADGGHHLGLGKALRPDHRLRMPELV